MDRNKRIGTLLVMLAITLACAPVLPSVAPLPTQPVGAVDTMIAGTYAAASTATAVNVTYTPTMPGTPTPTWTATITLEPTATFILKTPTMPYLGGGGGGGGSGGGSGGGGTTGGGGGGSGGGFVPKYTCRILKTTPALGAQLVGGTNFTTTWRVINTGNMVWDHNSVDYKFSSGTPMHTQSLYDLPINVAPKGQVDIVVNMQVPITPGTYLTVWVMQIGHDTFCPMKQRIISQ